MLSEEESGEDDKRALREALEEHRREKRSASKKP